MRRHPLAAIFITVLVDLLSYGMVIPLLPFFVQRFDGGATLVGSLGSLYALMQLLSGPILGTISDRVGRRPVLLTCLLGTSLAFTLLGVAQSLPLLVLAILLDGITGGNLTTAYAYIADITTPANRSRGMGLVGAAFGLGLIGGPALGGLLSVYGLGLPAFIAAALAAANVLFGLFALPESLPPERRSLELAWRRMNLFAQLRGLFSIASTRLLLLAVFLLNLAFSGLQTNFPLFSQARFGWNSFQIGIFFGFVGVCAVVVQGIIFRLVQPRLGEPLLSVAGLSLMMLGLGGTALARQGWLLYPLIALVALGSGISIPSLTALVSNQAGASMQGRLMGGMQALLNLSMIIGPSLAGLTFEHIAVPAPYWIGSLLSGLALAVAYLGLYRHAAVTPPSPS